MGLKVSAFSIGSAGFKNDILLDRALVRAITNGEALINAVDDFKVRLNAGGHTYTVGQGDAWIPARTSPRNRGAYFVSSDGDDTFGLPAVQSNPFIATVVLKVHDPQWGATGGHTPGAAYAVVSGSPASIPAALSDAAISTALDLPSTAWIRLADIQINTANTGAIPSAQGTDKRPFARYGQPPYIFGDYRPANALNWPAGQYQVLGSMTPFEINDTTRFSGSGGNTVNILKDGFYKLSAFLNLNAVASYYANYRFVITAPAGRAAPKHVAFHGWDAGVSYYDSYIVEPRMFLFAGTTIQAWLYSNNATLLRSHSLLVEAIL